MSSITDSTTPGIVVVGAGLAAAHVVAGLRERGHDGPVTLVGREHLRPYERPPLSKEYLQGEATLDEAFVHEEGWYAEHDVTTRFGTEVSAIDRSTHEIVLDGGERLPYSSLVLATGASPRRLDVPGGDLEGVLTLRDVADSDAIREAISAGGRMVIVGGGWIGLEVAAAARAAGTDVTVLEVAELPLLRVLGPVVAEHFAALHRAHGVDLRTGVTVEALHGEGGRVTAVVADGDAIPADAVIAGVGAVADTRLAADAGLEVDSGVLVDGHLRSVSDPEILAVGDVAQAQHTSLGTLRVEHWDNAIRQGKLAAEVLTGGEGVYDWQPYFFTDQHELGMEYLGRGDADDEVTIRGSLEGDEAVGAREFIAFWHRKGTVTAAMNVNIWDVGDELRALIGREVAAHRLADPDVPLGEL